MNPQNEQGTSDETTSTKITDATIVSLESTDSTGAQAATGITHNKKAVYGIVGLVLIGLAFGGFYYTKHQTSDAVAIVNGVSIARKDFDDSIALIKKTAELQGADLTQPGIEGEIKKQAVDTLVNNALLISGATAAGISATDADVQAKYDELTVTLGGAEALTARMTEIGLTEEKLRGNIRERIIVDAFINEKTDIESISVTDAEVKAFIDSISQDGAELPPLDEIKPQIEAQILGEKQQTIVDDLLKTLKTDAKIEIKI